MFLLISNHNLCAGQAPGYGSTGTCRTEQLILQQYLWWWSWQTVNGRARGFICCCNNSPSEAPKASKPACPYKIQTFFWSSANKASWSFHCISFQIFLTMLHCRAHSDFSVSNWFCFWVVFFLRMPSAEDVALNYNFYNSLQYDMHTGQVRRKSDTKGLSVDQWSINWD